MDRKYWIKVAVSMVVIFIVGAVVVHGVRAGITRGKVMLSSVMPAGLSAGLPLLHAGFRIDGDRVGDINRLQLMRATPGRVDSAVITVSLQHAAMLSRFSDCRLMVENGRHLDSHTSFDCATPADSASLDLVPFGHVVFEPGDNNVTLWVPNDQVAELARNAAHGAGDSGDVDIRSDHGNFSVSVNGHPIVQASGDSNGGSLVVRGPSGRPIVDISGDSAGGHVRIMDSQGRTKVDIQGPSSNH